MRNSSTTNDLEDGSMTDKEFVLSIYPEAVYIAVFIAGSRCIRTDDKSYFGWCVNKTEEETWAYAVHDIKYEMVKKLAQ